jgi:AraC-like DNA-binding protein
MHNINTLIRKIATTQLADLSSDKATIRLLVPTQKLMLITSEEHKQIQYGDIILLPENLAFKLKAQRLKSEKKVAKTACYLFEITPAFFQDKSWSHFFVKKSLTFIHATTPTVTIFIDAFEFLLSEIAFQRLAYKEAIDHYLNYICIHIERTYANYNQLDSHRQYEKERDVFHSINRYINTNYQENLTNKKIADHFYISENKLEQLYKTYSTNTVHQTLVSRRLISCKDLVLDGIPVTKAAEMVGFNNYSTFYRQFVHHFGMSPKEYFSKE